jgi:hypothetical protein
VLKEVKGLSESVPTTGDARFLKHRTEGMRQKMLEAKQDFVSFLLGLQSMRQQDYSLLAVHEKRGDAYIHLLAEWLNMNELFSEKELSYCPKLRNREFSKAMALLTYVPFCEKVVVPYMIAYVAVK